jgi:hypothetical protein
MQINARPGTYPGGGGAPPTPTIGARGTALAAVSQKTSRHHHARPCTTIVRSPEIVGSGGVIPARARIDVARMPRRPRAASARAQQIKSQGLHKGRHR